MKAKYSKDVTVHYYECDNQSRMTLQRLIQIAIEISGEQIHLLNQEIGRDVMSDEGLAWIIVQYEFDINRLPQAHETITIETEIGAYTKIFAERQFIIYDSDGNVLLTIDSVFAAFALEERKLARLPEDLFSHIDGLEQSKRLKRMPKPTKVTDVDGSKEYRIRYFDIDSNKHVNNAHYIEWSLDALGGEFLQTHDLTYANVKFEKEVHYGDLITSEYMVEEVNDDVHTHHRIQNGQVVNSEITYHFKKASTD